MGLEEDLIGKNVIIETQLQSGTGARANNIKTLVYLGKYNGTKYLFGKYVVELLDAQHFNEGGIIFDSKDNTNHTYQICSEKAYINPKFIISMDVNKKETPGKSLC